MVEAVITRQYRLFLAPSYLHRIIDAYVFMHPRLSNDFLLTSTAIAPGELQTVCRCRPASHRRRKRGEMGCEQLALALLHLMSAAAQCGIELASLRIVGYNIDANVAISHASSEQSRSVS